MKNGPAFLPEPPEEAGKEMVRMVVDYWEDLLRRREENERARIARMFAITEIPPVIVDRKTHLTGDFTA